MKRFFSLFIAIILVFYISYFSYANEFTSNKDINNKYTIFIDINDLNLSLINNITNKTEKIYPIAIGSIKTPSPIGNWKITSKAIKKGCFGGYWLGLNVPWDTFGIHGTNRPDSIGSMASSGCFRMHNNHVKEIFNLVEYGTSVIVYGGPNWRFSQYVRTIKPKDKGNDVYHVQRRLHDLGYFKEEPDGIYNYSLELAVQKFRKDFSIPGDSELDKDFLDSLGLLKFE